LGRGISRLHILRATIRRSHSLLIGPNSSILHEREGAVPPFLTFKAENRPPFIFAKSFNVRQVFNLFVTFEPLVNRDPSSIQHRSASNPSSASETSLHSGEDLHCDEAVSLFARFHNVGHRSIFRTNFHMTHRPCNAEPEPSPTTHHSNRSTHPQSRKQLQSHEKKPFDIANMPDGNTILHIIESK
jgi:hypothetical protein